MLAAEKRRLTLMTETWLFAPLDLSAFGDSLNLILAPGGVLDPQNSGIVFSIIFFGSPIVIEDPEEEETIVVVGNSPPYFSMTTEDLSLKVGDAGLYVVKYKDRDDSTEQLSFAAQIDSSSSFPEFVQLVMTSQGPIFMFHPTLAAHIGNYEFELTVTDTDSVNLGAAPLSETKSFTLIIQETEEEAASEETNEECEGEGCEAVEEVLPEGQFAGGFVPPVRVDIGKKEQDLEM